MGMFDDLVPQQANPPVPAPAAVPAAAQGGMFGDLIPKRNVVERGSVLPFTKYSDGSWDNFDWKNSGITGTLLKALTAPGDVYNGKMAPGGQEAIGRAFDLAGVVSPVNPAVRAGDFALAPGALKDSRPAKVAVPTSEQLRAAATDGYGQARGMGVDYSGGAVRDLAAGVRTQLEQDGILGNLAPKTHAILKQLETPPEGSVAPFQSVVAARRAFGLAAKDFNNPTEQLAAKHIIEKLDAFMANPDPASVVAGPAAAAGKIQAEANGNWAASKRSDYLTGIADNAERRAKAANSGRNLDNTIRQRIADVLGNDKRKAGFTAAEQATLEEIVAGTPTRNAAREISNLLGGGGGIGATLTGAMGASAGAGAAVGGPIGAVAGAIVPPLVGTASRITANKMARGAVAAADEQTRARSPLFQALMASRGEEAVPTGKKALLLRALLASEADNKR